MPNPGDIIGQRYQIIKKLGKGAFGQTYLAQEDGRGQSGLCVVKHLNIKDQPLLPDAKERFNIEANTLDRLGQHHRIPGLLSHLEENGELYLVQEFINGQELRAELSQKRRLNESEVVALLQDVLEILDFVHQQGVIHRDIKPSNLMRRFDDGRFVLIDFGAVKEQIGTLVFDQPQSTIAIGTSGYMPIEQRNGKPVYGSDLYAIGKTAIEALTGLKSAQLEHPETGELINWQEQVSISPPLVQLLNKLAHVNYRQRYQSAQAALHDLQPLRKVGLHLSTPQLHAQLDKYLGTGSLGHTYLARQFAQAPTVQTPHPSSNPDSSQDSDTFDQTTAVAAADSAYTTIVIKQLAVPITDNSVLNRLQQLADVQQVARLIDYFEWNGCHFLAREYIQGSVLTECILPPQIYGEQEAIALLKETLEVLDFIHQSGIVHGNLKLTNLVRRSGDEKLILLDLSLLSESGRPTFDSDLYSLGLATIHALTGTPSDQIKRNWETGEILWQEQVHVSETLAAILERMISANRDARYQFAAEVLNDLQPLLKLNAVLEGRFRITRYLGEGSLGYTYLGLDLQHLAQSRCIIKQFKQPCTSPLAWEKFEKLGNHGSIPQLIAHWQTHQTLFVARDYIIGEAIANDIAQGQRLSEEAVVALLKDVLKVLNLVHHQGLIHGNLKSSNIIRQRSDGTMALIDFDWFQAEDRTHQSDDLVALGMVAIQALTGTEAEKLREPQTEKMLFPQRFKVSPWLQKILTKMVNTNRNKRYRSASQVLRDLKVGKRAWSRYIAVAAVVLAAVPLVSLILQMNKIYRSFERGDTELTAGNYKRAIDNYRDGEAKIRKLPPLPFVKVFLNEDKALIKKAAAYSFLNQHEEMLQACQSALAIQAESVDAWICQGTAYNGLEDYQKAVTAYEKAAQINQNSFEAWNNLGYVYLKSDKPKEAIANFEQAITVDTDGSKSYVTQNELGILYHQRLKDYDKALNAYNEAIATKPDYIPALIGRGYVYKDLGDYSQAINSFQQALEVNDQAHEAWFGMGLVQEQLGQYADAIEAYERSLFIKSNYQAALTSRKRAQTKLAQAKTRE